jgi:uncharacterized membrane protein
MLRNPKALITARITLALYLATIITLVVTTFFPGPEEGVSISMVLAVKLLPLVGFIVPVYRGNSRAYIWLSFVIIFYFTQGVVSAWLSEGAIGPVITTVLTFLLFTVAMIHLKVNRPETA